MGIVTLGIDYAKNKDKPQSRAIKLDLSQAADQAAFWTLVGAGNVCYVHFGPPCDTASRAREIRRKDANGGSAEVDPRPLRSDEHPDGVSGLPAVDWERVRIANILYKFVASAVIELSRRKIRWTIENPQNSLMWSTSWMQDVLGQLGDAVQEVHFQMCMHGGQRDKKTTLWYGGFMSLQSLGLTCDKSHAHLPWALTKVEHEMYATAQERCYPKLLCQRLANEVRKDIGKAMPKTALSVDSNKIATERQPRRGLQELVPEFKRIERCFVQDTRNVGRLSKGDKVLDVIKESGGVVGSAPGIVELGRGWTPREFVDEARQLQHPFDQKTKIAPSVARAISRQASLGPEAIKQNRARTLSYYQRRKEALSSQEAEIHKALNPRVEAVVADKQILLFKELFKDIRYDDPAVADLLLLGTEVVGNLPKTGIWPPKEGKEARCGVNTLWAMAKDLQKEALKPKGEPRSGPDDRQELWDLTMEEVAAGGLRGPLTPEEVSDSLGSLWIAARRFLIKQGTKARPIDDFSACMINSAFGVSEKATLKSLDEIVGIADQLAPRVGEVAIFFGLKLFRDHGDVNIVDCVMCNWYRVTTVSVFHFGDFTICSVRPSRHNQYLGLVEL